MRVLFCFTVWLVSLLPASAQEVMQYLTATQNGIALPPSTGMPVDLSICRSVISANLKAAPSFGYKVKNGTIIDPLSNITITQSCVNNPDLYEPLPLRPTSVAPGVSRQLPAAPCPPADERMVLVTAGQSNASATGQSRYDASDHVFAYDNGQCFRAYDPLIGADGDDGSVWGRLADMLVSSGRYRNVVIIALARSGTTIEQWAPGGNLNDHLLTHLRDAASGGMVPTHLAWHHGEGNAGEVSTQQQYSALRSSYKNTFMSMVASIRSLGITAPIYPAVATICNMRSGRWSPSDIDGIVRFGPEKLIRKEWGRQAIRQAQRDVATGNGIKPGPDTDTISPWRRYDGCHFSDRGLRDHARLWYEVLTAQH